MTEPLFMRVTYREATLTGVVPVDDIERLIDETAKQAGKKGMTRIQAKDFIYSVMFHNQHLEQLGDGTYAVSKSGNLGLHLMLWVTCTSEHGEEVKAHAMQGGNTIEYEIIDLPEGRTNFRLKLHPTYKEDTAIITGHHRIQGTVH